MLDTNICIALIRGYVKVMARAAEIKPDDCLVSTVVVYELFAGVYKCQDPEGERRKLDKLFSLVRVVLFDEIAAEYAGQVRADLEKTGTTIGPCDLLLAGHALALGLPFVTDNVREFSRVKGLRIGNWLA